MWVETNLCWKRWRTAWLFPLPCHTSISAGGAVNKQVSTSDSSFSIDYNLEGKSLEKKDMDKYLGIILDKHLNYDEYTEAVILEINHKFLLLSKISYYMTDSIAMVVFKSMVASYFDCGDIIFKERE